VAAVLWRPHLWATAATQAVRLAAPGWWRRPPFVPLPDPEYVRFRLLTQYGGEALDRASGRLEPRDVVEYLEWCRTVAPGPRR
jgi:hypothetical protein